MSKWKSRLMNRVLAVILSGAMIMSDASLINITAYAAENSTRGGYSEESSEEYKSEENDVKAAENADDKDADAGIVDDMSNDDMSNDDTTNNDTTNDDASNDDDAAEPVEEATDSVDKADDTEDSDKKSTEAESAVADAAAVETTVEKASQATETEEVVEEETSEAEVTEEAVDNQASSADLTKGLKKGTEYGNDILKFYVLEDMPYGSSVVVADSGLNPKVNGNGPSDTNGWIPDTGAAFKIVALKASKISFQIKSATNKTYYFVKDDGGKGTVIKTAAVSESKNETHSFDMDKGGTYYFYVAGSRVSVFKINWEEREEVIDESKRKPWEGEGAVADPVIKDVSLDAGDASKINVTVDGVVGLDGADRMTVYMYDSEDPENTVIDSIVSAKEQDSTKFTFTPTKSGTYKFQAEMVRDAQSGKDKISAMSDPFPFACPFVPPTGLKAESLGGGKVQITWTAVPEVSKYRIKVAAADAPDTAIQTVDSTKASVTVSGLTKGDTYSFTVYSVKGEGEAEQVSAPSAPITHKVTDLKITWELHRYGNGAGKDGNAMKNDTGTSVNLISSGGKGKIVPASTDGLMFYCTPVSSNNNFIFKARAHVNSWEFSNGQEGFGVMAADRVGTDGNGSEFWNNSYQAMVSRISYRWNGVEISDDTGAKIEMQIGVGSTEKIGVTQDDLTKMSKEEITVPENFSAAQTAIDSTYAKYGAGQYNIVANCKNKDTRTDLTSKHEEYVNFELQVQRNNTGYFVSYTKVDNDGNYILGADGKPITTTKKYYDRDALSKLTKGTIYVGVFTARYADVTFSDMTLEVSDPKDDEPAEEKDVKYYNLAASVLSSTVTNSSDYDFIFHSNWNGTFVLKDSAGNILNVETDEYGQPVKAENGNYKPVKYNNVTGSLDPKKQALQDGFDESNTKVYIPIEGLSVGENVFTVEFTPDKEWCPDKDETTKKRYAELNSYDKVTFTYTVEYRKYGEPGQTIYVSQYGKSTNIGTKASPLDIYTAVKYAQPGQTILLAGGRYSLNRTLQTPRGVDGKPDIVIGEDGKKTETYKNYIKMMAEDPENRPVLDFNSLVPAVVTVGNYWYFKNFDVTRCKDGEKGIQVSSSNCVFDRVDTYKNGSTGLQISRLSAQDTYKDWPSDNLILNCNSYLNVDAGYEDADGFAAKLTSGSNNVFDGCIAAFNADDGWDLFAKVQTGSIGGVTIKNSLAYRNGYVLELNGEEGNFDEFGKLRQGKGNGNGFKMGGDGVVGGSIYDTDEDGNNYYEKNNAFMGHRLYNSYAFYNKSKGFDSNSCPNVKAYNSVSFNNGKSNIGFSTADKNRNTDYELKNVISFRTDGNSTSDEVKVKKSGKTTTYKTGINTTTYMWNGSASKNSDGSSISKTDFVSLTYDSLDCVDKDYWRYPDGTVNLHGFLQLDENSSSKAKPSMGATVSNNVEENIGDDTNGNITGAVDSGDGDDDYGEDYPEEGINSNSGHYGKIWVADINYLDYTDREEIYYTGKAVEPELHVRFSADVALLRKGKDYTVKYENNRDAGTATAHVIGAGSYKGFTVDKEFAIKPIAVDDYTVSIPSSVAVKSGGDALKEVKPTWQGKALKKDKDYTISEGTGNIVVTGIGNFTKSKTITVHTTDADNLISKASVKITTPAKELVYKGSDVEPECDVTLGGSTLTKGTDYTVEYANNVEIGKATLTVVGNGTTYFGSKSVNFSIKGGNLKDVVDVTFHKDYGENDQLKDATFNGTDCAIPENTIKLTLKSNDKVQLTNGIDYKIVQKGTNKAGTATVTIKGINGYTGALSYKFKITAKNIEELSPESFVYYKSIPYVAGGVKYDAGVNFNIKLGGYNVDSKHYTLSYKNNNMVGDATVVVKGRNGLTGKQEFTFNITPAEMTDNTDIAVSAKDIATNGKELKYADLKKSAIAVTQSYVAKGKVKTKKLSAGRDYDKNAIEYFIDKNNNCVIDESEEKNDKVDITSKEVVNDFTKNGYLTVLVRVHSASDNPKCNYAEGYVDGYFRVGLYDINKAKVINKKSRVYGENWKTGNGLSVAIDWSDTEVAKLENYINILYKTSDGEIPLTCNDRIGDYKTNKTNAAKYYAMDGFVIDPAGYKKNDRVGTASFTIVGTGQYAGTKKVPFKIISEEMAKKLIAKDKVDEVEMLKNNVRVSIRGKGSVLASLIQPDESDKKSSKPVNIIAEMGETVYLAQEAAPGYVFDKWESLEGTDLTTVEVKNDKFTMPEGNVSIEAVYKEKLQTVSGKFVGLDGEPLTGVSVTKLVFKNTNDGAVYTAAVKDDGYTVNLREESSYTAEITARGYKTEARFDVEAEALEKDLLLVEADDTPLERRANLYVGYSDKENNYKTINAALKDAKRMNPKSEDERITIHIKPGTYREQVFVNTNYITLINDTPEQEVKITWYYGIGYAYFSVDETGYYNETCAFYKDKKRNAARWGCAVRVKATDFKAENIVFENSFNRYITAEEIADGVTLSTAGTGSGISFKRTASVTEKQAASKEATERAAALALDTGSDRSEFYNCKFLGSQDTLYTGNGTSRAYYKNCFISGNTDYIFGDGNQVFEDCELNWQGYTSGANGGHITAAKDTSTLGYLFYNCTITKNSASGFTVKAGTLGRTWGAGARVTFVNTVQQTNDIITAAGWANMNGDPKNANYKEYNTTSADGKTISFSTSPRKEICAKTTTNPIDTKEKLEAYFGDWTPTFYGDAGSSN